jgi:hypothetical protein
MLSRPMRSRDLATSTDKTLRGSTSHRQVSSGTGYCRTSRNMNVLSALGLLLCLVSSDGFVFRGGNRVQHCRRANTVRLEASSRRDLCVQLASGFAIAFLPANAARASGGATAGGVYLLSVRCVKQGLATTAPLRRHCFLLAATKRCALIHSMQRFTSYALVGKTTIQ